MLNDMVLHLWKWIKDTELKEGKTTWKKNTKKQQQINHKQQR